MITTGISAVDWFISGELIEPPISTSDLRPLTSDL